MSVSQNKPSEKNSKKDKINDSYRPWDYKIHRIERRSVLVAKLVVDAIWEKIRVVTFDGLTLSRFCGIYARPEGCQAFGADGWHLL